MSSDRLTLCVGFFLRDNEKLEEFSSRAKCWTIEFENYYQFDLFINQFFVCKNSVFKLD